MNDSLAETPNLARFWCPGCEPTADPLREILHESYCTIHSPAMDGACDGWVHFSPEFAFVDALDGALNRAWCNALHRPGGAG